MKKLIMFILAVVVTLSACFAGMSFEQQKDNEMWNNLGNTESGFEVCVKSNDIKAATAFNKLTKVAQEYHDFKG